MNKTKKHLYTAEELFRIITKQLEDEGKIPEGLLEYSHATSENHEFRDYSFDILGTVNYGANEGIYIDLFFRGDIGNGAQGSYLPANTGDIGTIKTLHTSDEAFHQMAALMADFQIAASRFVNAHLDDFTWVGFDIDYIKPDEEEASYQTTCRGFKTLQEAKQHALMRMARDKNHLWDRALITENATGKITEIRICPHCVGCDCELSPGLNECFGSESEQEMCAYR